jgi:hypothetical protein
VRVGEWLKMELASVVKRQLEEGLTILMRKGDQQRYIKITKIEIIFADA